MALTKAYEICNLALNGIGENSITEAEFTTPGNNKVAKACVTFYEPERDTLMEQHPWRFALKRVKYNIVNFTDTITASTAASPVVITGTDISDANIISGLGVRIWGTGISGLDNNTFTALNVVDGSQTLELYKLDGVTAVDGSDYGVASAGYMRIAPISEYDYMYKLPTDLQRVWKVIGDIPYEREGQYLLIDSSEVSLRYIALITDVSLYPSSFIDCLATSLKSKLSRDISDRPNKANEFLVELEEVRLPRAYRTGAIEAIPKDNQQRKNPNTLTSWQQAGR